MCVCECVCVFVCAQCLMDYLEKKAIGNRTANHKQRAEPSAFKKVRTVET